MNAETILRRLIAIQSDSGTSMELAVAREIVDILAGDPYFKAHPDHYGAWDGGDLLGRPVVWALKKGSGLKTLVLSGHYDAVGIDNYGSLARLACDPDALMEALRADPGLAADIRADLESGDWLFARGAADMKAGLALNLEALLDYEPGSLNILMTAVSDEENLSAGARQAAGLYAQLAGRFGLEYALGVVGESNARKVSAGEAHPLINGSVGKIMPVVVARGHLAHAARCLSGLNSATLVARIADKVELNLDLVSQDKGVSTHPPSVQILRDMKVLYDVSMPEHSACAFNLTFLQSSDPLVMLEAIRGLCQQALEEGVSKYRAAYGAMADRGLLPREDMLDFAPAVYLSGEVEAMVAQKPGYEAFRQDLSHRLEQAVVRKEDTLQGATMKYLQALITFAGLPPATAVVGIAPPYYPAVNNDYLGPEASMVSQALVEALAPLGVRAQAVSYSQGMTDLSYMSCANPIAAMGVMDNIPLRGPVYDTDFNTIASIGIPTMLIGPAGKCIHQAGERVYLPDVRHNIPRVFRQLIALLADAR